MNDLKKMIKPGKQSLPMSTSGWMAQSYIIINSNKPYQA
jgi:hypothetical protein